MVYQVLLLVPFLGPPVRQLLAVNQVVHHLPDMAGMIRHAKAAFDQ
jgi:hypothetical protein